MIKKKKNLEGIIIIIFFCMVYSQALYILSGLHVFQKEGTRIEF